MNLKSNKILILGAHTDDCEIGCGAFISKQIKLGSEILCCAFSSADEAVPEGFAKDTLRNEMKSAVNRLGIQESHCRIFDFRLRRFPEFRQEILQKIIDLRHDFKPDLIMVPNSFDIHQDHQVIHQEGLRAFKHYNLLGYELPWNNLESSSRLLVEVAKDDIFAKKRALADYKSQAFRPYMNPDYIESWARYRGLQGNVNYAEAFEPIKLIL